MRKQLKTFYHTPLNLSNTIDLPSNLLKKPAQIKNIAKTIATPRSILASSHKNRSKKQEKVMLVQEKMKSKQSVLYKRLKHIKHTNLQLQKYSYSKLLSKMVVVDPQQAKNFYTLQRDGHEITSYSCLRGKLMNMEQQDTIDKTKRSIRYPSGFSNYSNRVSSKLFKRYYMPNNSKNNHPFFNKNPSEQKFIYINGQRKECKRIHNFYTSQNFRNSYDKVYGQNNDKISKYRQEYRKSISVK